MKSLWRQNLSKRALAAAAILGGCFASAPAANALEQPPQYPIGVGTLYDSFYPPVPGLFGFLYQLNIDDNSFRDNSGNKTKAFDHFGVHLNALAARVVGVWDAEFLGAKPITWVTLPVARFDGRIGIAGAGAPDFDTSSFIIGDGSVAQGLSWNFNKNWSAEASVEVFLPTGPYSTTPGRINFGGNITTFIPNAGFTYWNHDTNDTLSFKTQYFISTENDVTHYQNGNAFDLEFGGGIGLGRFSKNLAAWGLDFAGFALIQTEDDTVRGISNHARTELYGIGPQIRYNFDQGAIGVKWEHEFDGKAIGQGDRFWAQTGFPLWVKEKPLDAPLK